jgi:hypothetical protein
VQSLFAGGTALGVAPAIKAMDSEDSLLDEIERRACLYFEEAANPATGLVLDRVRVQGRETRSVASIAATGFGLSAMCIGAERGYVDSGTAKTRVVRTLEQLANETDNERGFFYHFIDAGTGQRRWISEVSSIDTTWLLMGLLHCREFWAKDAIARMAKDIVERVDWTWMLAGSDVLSHGWTPEAGFLPYQWDSYAESLAMYLIAIGANSPIPASTWDVMKRPMRDVDGYIYIDSTTPLFVHQYSHAWLDFRGRRDKYADYFRNSLRATEAHRQFCIDLSDKFPWYGPNMWGVTASDSRHGYRDWGSLPGHVDGTLVPCASGGSVAFLPRECGEVLRNMLDRYGNKVWTRYGFRDAFQPEANWWSPDVIGIDLGIMLIMAENARTGAVWNAMIGVPEVVRGMDAVGLKKV